MHGRKDQGGGVVPSRTPPIVAPHRRGCEHNSSEQPPGRRNCLQRTRYRPHFAPEYSAGSVAEMLLLLISIFQIDSDDVLLLVCPGQRSCFCCPSFCHHVVPGLTLLRQPCLVLTLPSITVDARRHQRSRRTQLEYLRSWRWGGELFGTVLADCRAVRLPYSQTAA